MVMSLIKIILVAWIAHVNGQTIVDINWVSGFSDPSTRSITADKGSVLVFSWQNNHNVWKFNDKEAFDACNFNAAEQLSGGAVSPVSYTLDETGYFGCEVRGHCTNGQKLAAMVPPSDDAVATTDINWVAGFSDSSARSIAVDEGTVLVFSWRNNHNVWKFSDKKSFDDCDFSAAEQISGGAVSPVSYTLVETGYFGCEVKGHCANGQKLEATLRSATGNVSNVDTNPSPSSSPISNPTSSPTRSLKSSLPPSMSNGITPPKGKSNDSSPTGMPASTATASEDMDSSSSLLSSSLHCCIYLVVYVAISL